MRSGHGRAATAAGIVLAGLALVYVGLRRPPANPAPPAAPAAQVQRVTLPPTPAATPMTALRLEESSFGSLGCASDEDVAHVDRPALEAHVNEMLDELFARAPERARSPDASEALRRGLVSLLGDGEADPMAAGSELLAAPDRYVESFDLAAAAISAYAIRMVADGDLPRAERAAEVAARESREAVFPAVLALVRMRARDATGTVSALREAHRRDPADVAIALELGLRLANGATPGEATDLLEIYLAAHPEDRVVAGRAARLATQDDLERGFTTLTRDGITLKTPPRLTANESASLLALIASGLSRAATLTGGARRPELVAVMYESRDDLLGTSCATSWTGAVFDGVLRLHTGILDDDAIRERTVRHETMHAQLASVSQRAPTWLHEGLAQYVSGERSSERMLRRLREGRSYVPFESLEGSFMVIDDAESAHFAYEQSLAMVEALASRDGERALARAVTLSANGERILPSLHFDADDLLAFAARAH